MCALVSKNKDSLIISSGLRNYIFSAIILALIAVITALVFVFRDQIAQFAVIGYPALFIVCFVLNCGVFGLSPSGLVAVEMSFIFDPAQTAIIAGLGAGFGESTSFYAGMKTDAFVKPKYLVRFKDFGQIKTGIIAFAASLVSGNLSDALGLACGRLRKCFAGFMIGAIGAKILKMLALVIAAHMTSSYFGILG